MLYLGILFLCNSHTTRIYNLSRPTSIEWVFSLDSNWLFNNEKYKKLAEFDFDSLDKLYEKCPTLKLEIEKQLRFYAYQSKPNF